jgi:hypothetical protein
MRPVLSIAGYLCFAAVVSHAAVIGYVNNPSSNSSDFASGVAANGGSITVLDFESHPLGALQSNFYPGVNISFSVPSVVKDAYPPAGVFQQQGSTGEGLYAGSRYLADAMGARYTMTISFDTPVLAAGFFVIDLYNGLSSSGHRVEAFTGQNGTGTLLGVFDAVKDNFQLNYTYFMGVLSTERNIGSLVYYNDRPAGDTVYFDNLEYAGTATPEPGTLALLALPLAALCVRRRT